MSYRTPVLLAGGGCFDLRAFNCSAWTSKSPKGAFHRSRDAVITHGKVGDVLLGPGGSVKPLAADGWIIAHTSARL